MDHDLLVTPLLSCRDAQRQRARTTLPGLLARLASGDLTEFPRLRAHQFHPWCMFLTQLAAIALRRAGTSDPRLSEEDWRELLLTLTAGEHEPWSLVVEDLGQPALFQPPVPEGTVEEWAACERPDDLDVLVTAKNHDVKTGLIRSDDLEAWVYAVVSLQTMQGYPGRGYNRVSRMKGGYGNRPRVGCSADHSLTSRFLRDLQVLLASWSELVERGYREDGLALVWTGPWDGTSSLAMSDLTPHFIEVCWRLRLFEGRAGLTCLYTTTRARRCLPEVEDGDVGDPWMPVARGGGALTVGSKGFGYRLLVQLLFENEFESAPAQRLRNDDADPMLFVASAMARGQGKTEGLHERVLVLSGPARWRLGQPDGRAALGTRASARVAAAEKIRNKVLYPALKQLALGGEPFRHELDARIDDNFFDSLFRTLSCTEEEARLAFDREIRDIAWGELQRVIDRCSVPDAQRLRAISDAERMFRGCFKKHFPDLVAAEAEQKGGPS